MPCSAQDLTSLMKERYFLQSFAKLIPDMLRLTQRRLCHVRQTTALIVAAVVATTIREAERYAW